MKNLKKKLLQGSLFFIGLQSIFFEHKYTIKILFYYLLTNLNL